MFSLCVHMRHRRLSSFAAACVATPRTLRHAARLATGRAAPTWGYVTDVEGDTAFWESYCRLSAVLEPGRALDDLALRPGCHLVFGGDSVDKGGGDLAFLDSLLRLKRRHPSRVHLLLGNRDINKMRLTAELAPPPSALWLPAAAHPGVYWRRSGATATPAGWLAAQAAPLADEPSSRLRWMLSDNMGSPRAFELRRSELAAARGVESGALSDRDVLRSFAGSLQRGGALRSFLQAGQLCALIGGTLFVHGGLKPDAVGSVPGREGGEGAGAREGVVAWVEAMNRFAASEVDEWCADGDAAAGPTWPGREDRLGHGFFDRPGGRLMSYGMASQPGGAKSPTASPLPFRGARGRRGQT